MQRAANVWDRFYRHHEAPWRGERPVADLLPLMGAGPVLELGCGNGKLLRPLRAAGIDAIGLDVAFHALRRLAAGTPRVLADAAILPFRDAAFTAVLDVHCTGHLGAEGRAQAAREAARVLRPGGHLVVERLTPADLRASQGKPVDGEPGMKEVEDGRRTHFAFAEELEAAFAVAGFTPLGGDVTRREPGHGGRQVVRESVRLAFRLDAPT
ncbi:MAG: class I SAM-dependent methyltransferase [Candidatus Thermoplasmatota archaeon]|jgi:SAM-dependent methyltransferase